MAPDYEVREFDLATARDRERVIDVGKGYDGVTVLAMPAGAAASLAFGSNRQLVPMIGAGLTFNVAAFDAQRCPVPADEGLFLSNPAGAGTFRLLISYSGIIVTGGL